MLTRDGCTTRASTGNFPHADNDYQGMATPQPMRTNTVTRLGWRAAVVLATVAGLCLPATSASAHAQLLRTNPAKNAVVAKPVDKVTLTFNEMVRQRDTTVAVTAGDGTSYSDGAVRVVDRNVIQAVRPLPPGPYRVAWRTVSADGDPVAGEFGFTIATAPRPTAAATPHTPTPAATTTAPALPTSASTPPSSAQPTAGTPPANRNQWLLAGAAAGIASLLAVTAGLIRRRRTPD